MCYLLARLFASKNKGKLAFAIFLFILSALRVGIYFQSERTISTGKNVHRNFIGLTTVEMEWLNGQRNGIWKGYSWKGKLLWQNEYKKGKATGAWRTWHPNGTLATEGFYTEGNRTGTWLTRFVDGQLETETRYLDEQENGKAIGVCRYYGQDGTLISEEILEDGHSQPIFKELKPISQNNNHLPAQ